MAKPFESRIQDLVYNVEVGVGLRIIKTGLYILFVLGVATLYIKEFKSLKYAEAMEYAQLARNFSWKLPPAQDPNTPRTRFVTNVIRPISMWYLIEHSDNPNPMIDRHPDLLHPPVYPVVLSTLFSIAKPDFKYGGGSEGKYKPEQMVIIPLGLLLTLLTGLFVYLLANRLFDRRVALLGVTIFFLSDAIWSHAISGLPITLALFLGILSFYFGTVAVTNKRLAASPVRWLLPLAASVICCILAFLTQYTAIALLPGLMLFIGVGFRDKGWIWSLAILFVFIGGMSPWVMRNVKVSGSFFGLAPYEALKDTYVYPRNTFERKLAPDLDEDADKISKGLQNKFAINLKKYFNGSLFQLGDGLLTCLFIATFFFRFMNAATHTLRWGAALTLFTTFLIAGFFGESAAQIFHIMWPIAILYGCGFFFLLLDRLQFNIKLVNMLVTTAVIVISAIPTIFTLLPPRAEVPYPPYYAPLINYVTGMIQEDELLCTDMPWATAWYGQSNSLLLPNTIDEFYNINDYSKRVSGIYFTTLTRDQKYISGLLNGNERTWFPIMQGRIPNDFPLSQGFPLNNLDQLFLTDRRRWEEQ